MRDRQQFLFGCFRFNAMVVSLWFGYFRDLPHIDQVLCEGYRLRVARDGDGAVHIATRFAIFAIRDANHGTAELSEKCKAFPTMEPKARNVPWETQIQGKYVCLTLSPFCNIKKE